MSYVVSGPWVTASVGGTPMQARVMQASPDAVDAEIDGLRRRYTVRRAGASVHVAGPDGSSTFTEVERFPLPGSHSAPGSLLAPMPGTIVRVAAAPGDAVGSGDALVILEAMKMEHAVRAPHDGTVREVHVAAGQQVDAGTVLAVVDAAGDT